MNGRCWILAFTTALLLSASVTQATARSAPSILVVGNTHAIDGDTLDVAETRVRRHGIDAQEPRQRYGAPSGEQWACGQRARGESNLAARAAIAHVGHRYCPSQVTPGT